MMSLILPSSFTGLRRISRRELLRRAFWTVARHESFVFVTLLAVAAAWTVSVWYDISAGVLDDGQRAAVVAEHAGVALDRAAFDAAVATSDARAAVFADLAPVGGTDPFHPATYRPAATDGLAR